MSQVTLDRIALAAVLVAIWQILHQIAGAFALPSPYATLQMAGVLLGEEDFARHALASLKALAAATAIAVLGGTALGLWLGTARLAAAVAEPFLTAIYALPKVTLYPMILLIFGLGLQSKIAFGALHGIMPITIFVMTGVRSISPVLLKTARSMRLSPWQSAMRIVLPAALPELLSGLRVGLSLTLPGTLIGEMFASREGIGFLLVQGITLLDGERILALTLLLFAFSVSMNLLLYSAEYRLRGRLRPQG